jgi:hypothetical protein
MVCPLMVVYDLNVVRIALAPAKANSPLIVDPDAVLAFPIAPQGFQPVPWQPQIPEASRGI